MKAIFAVMNTTSAVVRKGPEKIQACTSKFRPVLQNSGLYFKHQACMSKSAFIFK